MRLYAQPLVLSPQLMEPLDGVCSYAVMIIGSFWVHFVDFFLCDGLIAYY
jgi:hypothetical protein